MHPIHQFLLANVGTAALASFVWYTAVLQYIGAVWVGFKDKSHNIPLAVSMFFFAHDVLYIVLGMPGRWSYLIWIVGHLCVTYQIIAYSRTEVRLGSSLPRAAAIYLVMQVGMCILVWWLKELMADITHAKLNAVMFVLCQLFLIPLLLSRGSRKGQSLLTAWMLLVQAATYFFLFQPVQDPAMASRAFYATGVVTTVLSIIYLIMLYRARVTDDRVGYGSAPLEQ